MFNAPDLTGLKEPHTDWKAITCGESLQKTVCLCSDRISGMTFGARIMGKSFSPEEELLDRDVHITDKPREGRVALVPGLFLFRLQTFQATGIPPLTNPALKVTLYWHCTCTHVELPANTEQLAVPICPLTGCFNAGTL